MAANIMWAWVMTIPATAIIAWTAFTLLHWWAESRGVQRVAWAVPPRHPSIYSSLGSGDAGLGAPDCPKD